MKSYSYHIKQLFVLPFFWVFSFSSLNGNAQTNLDPWEPQFDSAYAMDFCRSLIVFDNYKLPYFFKRSQLISAAGLNAKVVYSISEKKSLWDRVKNRKKFKSHLIKDFKDGLLISEKSGSSIADTFALFKYKHNEKSLLYTSKFVYLEQKDSSVTEYYFNEKGLPDSIFIKTSVLDHLKRVSKKFITYGYFLKNITDAQNDVTPVKYFYHYNIAGWIDTVTIEYKGEFHKKYLTYKLFKNDDTGFKRKIGALTLNHSYFPKADDSIYHFPDSVISIELYDAGDIDRKMFRNKPIKTAIIQYKDNQVLVTTDELEEIEQYQRSGTYDPRYSEKQIDKVKNIHNIEMTPGRLTRAILFSYKGNKIVQWVYSSSGKPYITSDESFSILKRKNRFNSRGQIKKIKTTIIGIK